MSHDDNEALFNDQSDLSDTEMEVLTQLGNWWHYHFRPFYRLTWSEWLLNPGSARRVKLNLDSGNKKFIEYLKSSGNKDSLDSLIKRLPEKHCARQYIENELQF